MRNSGEYIDAVHKRLAPFKHWYLQEIGVDPQFKGKGYAGKLLRPMFARIDEEGLPCYLETWDEKMSRYMSTSVLGWSKNLPFPKLSSLIGPC